MISIFTKPIPVKLGDEDTPKLSEQTEFETGFYRFPNQHSGVEYFNCGLVNWENKDWLVTRRRNLFIGKVGHNDIVFWLMKDNAPIQGFPARINRRYVGEHHEDPRAINRNGKIWLSYCNFRVKGSWAHQSAVQLDNMFRGHNPMHVPYGKNGNHLLGNSGHEKNWIWFDHNGELHFIYMTFPHIVCKVEHGVVIDEYETDKFNWKWKHGDPRGGTPPIRIGNLYYAFFHSSLPNKKFRARYYAGAYCFKAEPPFEMVSMTSEPLLGGSEYDPRNPAAPLVVFPCGSKFDGESWLVTMGVNDFVSGFIKIPHDKLLERMQPCV